MRKYIKGLVIALIMLAFVNAFGINLNPFAGKEEVKTEEVAAEATAENIIEETATAEETVTEEKVEDKVEEEAVAKEIEEKTDETVAEETTPEKEEAAMAAVDEEEAEAEGEEEKLLAEAVEGVTPDVAVTPSVEVIEPKIFLVLAPMTAVEEIVTAGETAAVTPAFGEELIAEAITINEIEDDGIVREGEVWKFKTLQAALDEVTAGITIKLEAGVYEGMYVWPEVADISLVGTKTSIGKTVFSGVSTNITIPDGVKATIVDIDFVEVVNEEMYAIHVGNEAKLTISGSAFLKNKGAIYVDYGKTAINGCYFQGNTAESGAAIYGGDNYISYSRFINNIATEGDGGAIANANNNIRNCTFIDNKAEKGYGGAIARSRNNILSSKFSGNIAKYGNAISLSESTIAKTSFEIGDDVTLGITLYEKNNIMPAAQDK